MVLQKQLIRIPFGAGVDTKSDPKLFDPPLLSTLENCAFDETGNLRKRYGQRALETTGDPTTGHTVFANGNQLVQLVDFPYIYNAKNQRWKVPVAQDGDTISYSYPIEVNQRVIARTEQTSGAVRGSIAVVNGVIVCAWCEVWGSSNQIKTIIIEQSTGNVIVPPQKLVSAVTGATPKLAVASNSIWLIVNNTGNTLTGYRLNTASLPLTWSAGTSLGTDFASGDSLDATDGANSFHIAYRDLSSTTKVKEFSDSGSSAHSTTVSVDCNGAVAVYYNPDINDSQVYVFTAATSASNLSCTILSSSYSVAVATFTALTIDGTAWLGVTATQADSGTIGVFLCASATSDATDEAHTLFAVINSAGTITSFTGQAHNLVCIAKSCTYNGKSFCILTTPNTLPGTTVPSSYLMTPGNGAISPRVYPVARLWHDNGPPTLGTSTYRHLSPTYIVSAVGYTLRSVLADNPTSTDFLFGQDMATFSFTSQPPRSIQLGNGTLVAAGNGLHYFDGRGYFENTPHTSALDSSAGGNGSGAQPAAGTYSYKIVFEWKDANGNIHRSAPSAAVSLTLGAGQNVDFDYWLPDELFASELPYGTTARLYRTTNAGTVYFLTTFGLAFGNPTSKAGRYRLTDVSSDATIQSNEVLYTEGDVLQNDPTPPLLDVVQHGNRVFCLSAQNRNEVWYSKYLSAGVAPEFNTVLMLRIDQAGVEGTGIASLDDKLVVFTRDAVYVVAGDGPLDTGLQDSFSRPQKISSDVGCIERNSITSGPFGVVFKSARGIYLLDRSLQIVYIGAPVEDYNSNTIISGVLIPERSQVRFGLSGSGNCLVWDYQRNQWSVFTAHEQVHACLWQGDYTRITNGGSTFVEDSSTYLDDATGIVANIITAWIKVAGLAGFQRISKARFVGASSSPHPSISMQVGYDYAASFTHTYSWSQSDISALSRFELEARLTRQKCEAIRFRISDGSLLNAPWSLAELDLWIGTKTGVGKLPIAHRKSGS